MDANLNQRVLEEARDAKNPLLERVKFLAITASNLDEFVEVRVAGILQQVEHGNIEPGPDGRAPAEVLKELAEKIHSFVKAQYDCWREELLLGAHRGICSRGELEETGPCSAFVH